MSDNLTDQQRQEIEAAIIAGQKIQAIKPLRHAAGADLLTAKQVVEAREAELRQSLPEKFAAAKGKGCMTSVVVVLSIAVPLVLCICKAGGLW